MVNSLNEVQVGDLVRIIKASANFGLVLEISDSWSQGTAHHAKVHWMGGEMRDPPAATWMPLSDLEIISKVKKEIDNE